MSPMYWSVTYTITFMTGSGSQLSVAGQTVKTGSAGHSMEMLSPCPLICGAVVSCTVIVWLTVSETLPEQSWACQVMVRL